MKKSALILCFFILLSCNNFSKKTCNLCKNITFFELKNKINLFCTFVAILKNDACSVCQKYNFQLDNYLKNNEITIYSLDTTTLDLNDYDVHNLINEIKDKTGVNDNAILPSTLFYLDGVLVNVEIGVLSEKDLTNNIEFLFSL